MASKQSKQTKDVSKLAVIYARYSSHGQTEQSIEGQLSAGRAYCATRGYTIVREYIDRAMTGKNDDREAFQQMLTDTSTRTFGVIILWKIDRFGRNREEIAFNKHTAKKNGVRVERVAEAIPDAPEGVILDSVLEGMAEYYSLQLAQNVRRGQRESAKKGQSVGGNRALGYVSDRDTKKYVLDPDTAPYVKEIFRRYAAGSTIAETVDWLNGQGIRTVRGNPFTINSLHKLLKNEKYTGVYIFHDIRIEGGMPQIVSRATFDKVQEMLKVNRRAPARVWSKCEYLLTDKLFCGLCGGGMVGESGSSRNGTKYSYYTCLAKKRNHSCDKKAVRQDWIEAEVMRYVSGLLSDDALLDYIACSSWDLYQSQDESIGERKALERQLDSVNASIQNLLKALEAGIINDTVTERMNDLDKQKKELSGALAKIEMSKKFRLTKEHILFFLYEMRKLDVKDRDCQKRLIDTFVNRIYVFDDKLVLTFNYTDGKGDKATITLKDIDDVTSNSVFGCCAPCPTKGQTSEHQIIFWPGAFGIVVEMPER